MWLNLTSAPAETPVSLAEAKAHLRVLHSHEDALITALIGAVTSHLDGRFGALGRCLVTQGWEYRTHCFPACGRIEIPLPPLVSVTAATYVDDAGAVQTLAADQYVVDANTFVGAVRRAYDVTWPVARQEAHAVRIAFTAGYGAAAAVPGPIKQAMLLIIGHLHQNRASVRETTPGSDIVEVPQAAEYLLAPYRVQSF